MSICHCDRQSFTAITNKTLPTRSVVVLEESPCPRGPSPCPWTSSPSPCPLALSHCPFHQTLSPDNITANYNCQHYTDTDRRQLRSSTVNTQHMFDHPDKFMSW